MFKRFGLGLSTYVDAHHLIVKHNLWRYLLMPGIINVILFSLFIWGVFSFADYTSAAVLDWVGLSEPIEGFFKYLKQILFFVIGFIIKIVLLIMYLSVYKYITLILLSPILAMLSERTERILTGKEFNINAVQFVKDIARGIKIALRNLFIEILCMFIGYLLMFVPIVNLFIPFVLFFISSYFMGFSMIDYNNERHKLSIPQSLTFVRSNKGMATGNGFIFNLMFMVPFIGWLVAPGYATVAATIATHKVKNNLV